MPRFYFNYFDGNQLIIDEDGQDLETLDRAREQAELHARDRLREITKRGVSICDEMVEVMSEAGKMVTAVPLSTMTDDLDC